jgi:hypothetical protein
VEQCYNLYLLEIESITGLYEQVFFVIIICSELNFLLLLLKKDPGHQSRVSGQQLALQQPGVLPIVVVVTLPFIFFYAKAVARGTLLVTGQNGRAFAVTRDVGR